MPHQEPTFRFDVHHLVAEGRFVDTKVHTFAVTTGDALKRVEALSPRKIMGSQRDAWCPEKLPKLKVASSNLVSRSRKSGSFGQLRELCSRVVLLLDSETPPGTPLKWGKWRAWAVYVGTSYSTPAPAARFSSGAGHGW
jgi:hypothetical protein